jgi:hypothetical protein
MVGNNIMTSLTIVHVEDEYSDFLSLTTTLKTLIEDHWFANYDKPVIAARRVLAESQEKPPSWVAYELVVNERPTQTFRWIFVRDAQLPDEIKPHMMGRIAFIFDVLRPDDNGTTMQVSLEETLRSIEGIEVQSRDVVVYTAYQGTGIDAISPNLLNVVGHRIRKENDFELDEFLSNLILECINDG